MYYNRKQLFKMVKTEKVTDPKHLLGGVNK